MAEVRQEVFARLGKMGIAFDWVEHPPVGSMADCLAPARELEALMPKNLFLAPRNLSAFYLLLLRPEAEFHTSQVSRQLGASRLGFAPPEKLWELLRTRPGAISPMGLLFDGNRAVRLAVDERLRGEERLAFHPCENTCSLAMKGEDFFGKFLHSLGKQVEFVQIGQEEA